MPRFDASRVTGVPMRFLYRQCGVTLNMWRFDIRYRDFWVNTASHPH